MSMTFICLIEKSTPKIFHKYIQRIKGSSIGYRLMKGAFWSLSGACIAKALTLLTSILIARFLGKSGFGELGIIQSTIGMFGTFAGFGMGLTATKHVAEFREKDPVRAGHIIGLSSLVSIVSGLVMCGGLYLAAPYLAIQTINAPHLANALRISALLLFFSGVSGAQTGALAGFESFETIAKVNFLVGVISFPAMYIGALLGQLEGAVWGLGVTMVANSVINYSFLNREMKKYHIRLGYRGCLSEWPVLWSFSLPAVLGGVMVAPANWICSAMLVNRPSGYSEMGVFNAASQWRNAVLFLPTALSAIVLPMLSNLRAEENSRRYSKVLIFNVILIGALSFSVAVVISLLSRYIMMSYGHGFVSGGSSLIILSFSAVFMSMAGVLGQSFASNGKMWIGFWLNCIWAALLIGFTRLLIFQGARGLSWATLLSYMVHFVMVFLIIYLVFKDLRITGKQKEPLPIPPSPLQ